MVFFALATDAKDFNNVVDYDRWVLDRKNGIGTQYELCFCFSLLLLLFFYGFTFKAQVVRIQPYNWICDRYTQCQCHFKSLFPLNFYSNFYHVQFFFVQPLLLLFRFLVILVLLSSSHTFFLPVMMCATYRCMLVVARNWPKETNMFLECMRGPPQKKDVMCSSEQTSAFYFTHQHVSKTVPN